VNMWNVMIDRGAVLSVTCLCQSPVYVNNLHTPCHSVHRPRVEIRIRIGPWHPPLIRQCCFSYTECYKMSRWCKWWWRLYRRQCQVKRVLLLLLYVGFITVVMRWMHEKSDLLRKS